ncbi:MAG TPA: U32 family peptidase [Bacillota bacterium]|nr:U32 family peptidase [Bacillota bacterium]
MNSTPELLCPAGGEEQLRAAVYAGCDAVYFGGGAFNARMNADNFGEDDIVKAVRFCRLFGVKVYITLNTLLTDKSLKGVLSFAAFLEENARPDAYIVQDLGLMRSLHERFPGAHIHASTQMALHSSGCVEILKKYGVTRIICAREMSRQDIASLSRVYETEVFVHGALCVSQSGGCLFSSMVAKNSGNAGRCAQPCRLAYRCADPYPLSLKDNCLARHITSLTDAGVASLKIEGRMKDAKYVYIACSIYRKLLDEGRNATDTEIKILSDSFSRSGFTDGYFTSHRDGAMFGVRTEADKEKTRVSAKQTVITERTIPVDIMCTIEQGKPASLTFSARGAVRTVRGQTPEEALTAPLTEDSVKKSVTKLGGTGFKAENVTVRLDDTLNLPVSALNALRRSASEALTEALIMLSVPERKGKSAAEPEPERVRTAPYTVIRYEGAFPENELPEADFYDLPLWRADEFLGGKNVLLSHLASQQPEKIRVLLPRVVFDSETRQTAKMLDRARAAGIKRAVIRNLSQIPLTDGFERCADATLNVMNSDSLAVLSEYVSSAVLSPELTAGAAGAVKPYTAQELLVYGRIELMHTENCIIRNVTGKCEKQERCTAYMTDRIGEKFLLMRETSHRNVIFNSVGLWLCDMQEIGERYGMIYVFTDEDEATAKKILSGIKPERYTRGYYR